MSDIYRKWTGRRVALRRDFKSRAGEEFKRGTEFTVRHAASGRYELSCADDCGGTRKLIVRRQSDLKLIPEKATTA